jgi:hypothetical protein
MLCRDSHTGTEHLKEQTDLCALSQFPQWLCSRSACTLVTIPTELSTFFYPCISLKFKGCFRRGIMLRALVLTPACNLLLLILMLIWRRCNNIRLFIADGKKWKLNWKLLWWKRSWSSRHICLVILEKSWNRPGRLIDDPAEMHLAVSHT